MKTLVLSILIFASLIAKANPADSLKKRKHFAIEGDVSFSKARINTLVPAFPYVLKASFNDPNFINYNFAFVYNIRGIKRDCSDPVHDLSFAAGASFMKMNIEERFVDYRYTATDYYSDYTFNSQKIKYTYNPVELCLLFRYTYSTRKLFASFNAGVSRVFLDDSKSSAINYIKNTVTTTGNGTSTETISSTANAGHYLVRNNSTNNILGLRLGYNGKLITPYITLERHGATSYTYFKAGVGAMYFF